MSGLSKLKGLCGRCANDGECLALCEKAERYASQDHVPQREFVVADLKPDHQHNIEVYELTEHEFLDFLCNQNCNNHGSWLLPADLEQTFPQRLNFKGLSALDNEIVRLRYFEKLRFKEIARQCHRKADTCRKRYHRAIEKLKVINADRRKSNNGAA